MPIHPEARISKTHLSLSTTNSFNTPNQLSLVIEAVPSSLLGFQIIMMSLRVLASSDPRAASSKAISFNPCRKQAEWQETAAPSIYRNNNTLKIKNNNLIGPWSRHSAKLIIRPTPTSTLKIRSALDSDEPHISDNKFTYKYSKNIFNKNNWYFYRTFLPPKILTW